LLPSYKDEDEPEATSDEEDEGSEEWDEEDENENEGGTAAPRAISHGHVGGAVADNDSYDEPELEEEDEASEFYFSGDETSDPEREARRPPNFQAFLEMLGEDHGYQFEELFYAYHEDRWDEYLF